MEALPDLQQVEIVRLAKDVLPGHYIELCVALGYSINQGDAVLASHQSKYKEATTQVLNDWNTKQIERNQIRSNLARKLKEAELGELGTKLSTGKYLQSEDKLSNQEAVPGDSDIFGKKISESLTVGKCREKLRHKYLYNLCKIQLNPWDKSDYAELKDLHTVVTMMRKDSNGRDTKKKEELEGSVDKIFSTKVNGRLPSRILISAPAGVGKTTAVAKMAYDWAQEEKESALEQLPLLFVVKFRNTSQRTSIGEAIISQLLSDVDDLTPDGIEVFIRRNQEICHIILDGLDEYAGISSSNNVISVIRGDEFPQSRVLVTTRPHLESYFNKGDLPRVYTKMWIEGFSPERSEEYIDRFFTLNQIGENGRLLKESLKEYLRKQTLIYELIKTPLFCLMICNLWSENQLDDKLSTQTDLFDSVNVFLMHHANARLEPTTPRKKFTSRNLGTIVNKIGRIALYGLLDDSKKLIFTQKDFQKVPAILDKACELGIVSKTTIPLRNPQSEVTDTTEIEFYHKLAQEHSAGKFLASQAWRILMWLRISTLDWILTWISKNIGDYDQLIRFAAGTDRNLGIRIMEVLLANKHLEESERYRILLDCSSESKDSEGDMSSFVQRCITAQRMILKAPTIYTVVGLQNLPKQLKLKVKTLMFKESILTADLTSRLWSCLTLFPSLRTISITDSSLSFPSSLPKLPSFTRLSAERITPSCYSSVLSSIPNARELDVFIVIEGTTNNFEITVNANPTRELLDHQHDMNMINVTLHKWVSQSSNTMNELEVRSRGLTILFQDESMEQLRLSVSGDMGRYEETLVDLFAKTTNYLHCISLDKWQIDFDTSSGDKLPSVTKLSVKEVTSQCYEGLISSLPGLEDIDITIDDAEENIACFIAVLRRTAGQKLKHIYLYGLPSPSSERNRVSRETIGGLGLLIKELTQNLKELHLRWVKCTNEDGLVYLINCCRHVKAMKRVLLWRCRTMPYGILQSHIEHLHRETFDGLHVEVWHDDGGDCSYTIPHTDHVD